jgi:hypothetical protein
MISLKDKKRPTILLLLPSPKCSLPPENTLFCLAVSKGCQSSVESYPRISVFSFLPQFHQFQNFQRLRMDRNQEKTCWDSLTGSDVLDEPNSVYLLWLVVDIIWWSSQKFENNLSIHIIMVVISQIYWYENSAGTLELCGSYGPWWLRLWLRS